MPHAGEYLPQEPADAYTPPTAFLNAWVNYGAPFTDAGFFKDHRGIVYLKGLVKNGVVGNTVFNLPVGCRPTTTELFPSISDTGVGRVDVASDGRVVIVSGGNTYHSLSGIFFRAQQ
jgi:hypothetical protein